jgi:hypothetical protein
VATVEIAGEVWRAWESLREQDEPTVMLRFEPIGDPGEAARAMRDCIMQVTGAFDASLEASGESSSVGEWGWLRAADGVLVNIIETDILEKILPDVAQALERREIGGTFRLRHDETGVRSPTYAEHVECRLRVRGERVQLGPQNYRWRPNRDAHAACLLAAEEWCRHEHGRPLCGIRKDMFGPVAVASDEPLADRLIDAARDDMAISLVCANADDFRAVSVRPYSGGVSLVAGGPSINAGAWRAVVAEFTDLLERLANAIAYAHVRRGWSSAEALISDTLPSDWPKRPDYAPRGQSFTDQAFEDVYAPDAFAVQLLGRGYDGRVPAHRSWREHRVGDGVVLLEHVDLATWFDHSFIPRDTRQSANQAPPPAVLTAARSELAPILYTPGILYSTGYADERGL